MLLFKMVWMYTHSMPERIDQDQRYRAYVESQNGASGSPAEDLTRSKEFQEARAKLELSGDQDLPVSRETAMYISQRIETACTDVERNPATEFLIGEMQSPYIRLSAIAEASPGQRTPLMSVAEAKEANLIASVMEWEKDGQYTNTLDYLSMVRNRAAAVQQRCAVEWQKHQDSNLTEGLNPVEIMNLPPERYIKVDPEVLQTAQDVVNSNHMLRKVAPALEYANERLSQPA